MRAPAVSFANKFFATFMAALLTFTLLPASALAEGEATDPSVGEGQETNPAQADEAAGASPRRVVAESQGLSAPLALPDLGSTPAASSAEAGTLAASLIGRPASFVSVDVALDGESVVGSFTVDGMTFAVVDDSTVELVGVSEAAAVDSTPAASETEAEALPLMLPETVAYNGIEYSVSSIGAYAFYLSGVTSVELPASVTDVDDRAFRSSDVASVKVVEGNSAYSSFDGALYDAAQLSLLLIPEGKQGTVLLPKTAESAAPSVFSHCPLVTQISVEEGSAAFASENGLLYDVSLETLLRVPAGATEITIHDGCTTIAAGAMKACASLAIINVPASVISISPYLFDQQPETVMAPVAVAAVESDAEGDSADEGKPADAAQQLSAMVALSSADDDLPTVDPAAVAISLPAGADAAPWRAAGFSVDEPQGEAESHDEAVEGGEGEEPNLPVASLGSASTYAGAYDITIVNAEGSTLYQTNSSGSTNTQIDSKVIGCGEASHQVHVRFLNKGGSLIVQLWHSATSDNSYYRWVKPGYVLVGVKVTNGAGTVTDEIRATEVGTSYKGASAIKGAGRTIAPIFERVTYTVSFDGNGATTMPATSTQSVYYGSSLSAVTPPKKKGSNFLGYFSSTSSSAVQYFDASGKPTRTWGQCEQYPTSLSTTKAYTLYAQWKYPGEYDVTFNANGGKVWGSATWVPSSPKVTQNATSWNMVTCATRTGRTFTGWWSAPSGGVQVYKPNGKGQAVCTNEGTYWSSNAWVYGDNATLYAQWEPAVTVDMQGGTATVVNCDVSGNQTQFPLESSYAVVFSASGAAWLNSGGSEENKRITGVTRAGYGFCGWSTNKSCAPADAGNYTWYKSAGEITVYAIWKPLITVDMNGGTATLFGVANQTKVTHDYTGRYNVFYASHQSWDHSGLTIANDYRRAGYTLAGWSTDKNCKPAEAIDGLTWMGTEPLTIYAIWRANTITLTWNPNGGNWSGSTASVTSSATYSETAKVTLPATPANTGKTFAGWWTAASGGTQVTASTALPTVNATYYAHWSNDPYTITYNLNGGSAANPTTYDVTTTTFTLKNPTRTGYTFAGWSGTGLSGSENMTVTIAKGSIGNRTFTANWVANTYKVTFDKNGGTGGADSVTVTFGSGNYSDISWGLPKRAGYTFAGYDDASGNPIWTGDGYLVRGTYWNPHWAHAGDVTAVAQWEANEIMLTWDAQDKSDPAKESIVYSENAKVVTPTPPWRDGGWVFTGWWTEPDGGNQVTTGMPLPAEDTTYYAHWAPAVSADVPIEVVASVDLFDVEEQEEASGYIESRSASALEVAQVDFKPLEGADDLFGANVASVFLEAFAEDSASADYRFALDAAAAIKAADGTMEAASLAPFSLPNGYGTRKHIAYRFDIPADVLAAIDAERFEQVTTPIASVMYTVALAKG